MAERKWYCQKDGTVLQFPATTAANDQAEGYCPTCAAKVMGKDTPPKQGDSTESRP